MRRGAATLTATLALAGCGGDDATTTVETGSPPPPTATTVEDTAAVERAFRGFLDAAARGDTHVLWVGLTTQAQQRLGPTEEQFAAQAAGPLSSGLGSVDPERAETIVAETTGGGWAVIAVRRDDAVFASPMRFERGAWRVDVGGAVSVEPEAPRPGAAPAGPNIRARVDAATRPTEARIWLDGRSLPVTVGEAGALSAPLGGLSSGTHTLVVYAQTPEDGAATAWTFGSGG